MEKGLLFFGGGSDLQQIEIEVMWVLGSDKLGYNSTQTRRMYGLMNFPTWTVKGMATLKGKWLGKDSHPMEGL